MDDPSSESVDIRKNALVNYYSMDWEIISLVEISQNFWLINFFPLENGLTETLHISKKPKQTLFM